MEKKDSPKLHIITKLAITVFCLFFLLIFAVFGIVYFENLKPTIASSLREGSLDIKPIITERQTGKTVEGGIYLHCCAQVPDNIAPEKIKPTLLEGMNTLINDNEEVKWIALWLTTDSCENKTGNFFAKAEYKDNQITFLGTPAPEGSDYDLETIKLEK